MSPRRCMRYVSGTVCAIYFRVIMKLISVLNMKRAASFEMKSILSYVVLAVGLVMIIAISVHAESNGLNSKHSDSDKYLWRQVADKSALYTQPKRISSARCYPASDGDLAPGQAYSTRSGGDLSSCNAVNVPPHRQPVSSAWIPFPSRGPSVDQCPNRIFIPALLRGHSNQGFRCFG